MELSGDIYLCSAGETFDNIAFDLYEDEKYAEELMCANPEHCGKLVFTGGETLYLPEIELPEPDEETERPTIPPWKE